MFTAKLDNPRQIERTLTKLDQTTAKKVVRTATRTGAKPVLQAAKASAPVESGALKGALALRRHKERGMRDAYAVSVQFKQVEERGLVTRNTGERGGEPGKRHFYPYAIELGAPHRAATPFLRPALERNRRTYVRLATDEIRRGILQAVGR